MSVSKETKATTEGISRLEKLSKRPMEYFVENKFHQNEEVASQNVELSFREKIKDKSYMMTVENLISRFFDRFTVNVNSYAASVDKFSEYYPSFFYKSDV